MSYDPIVAEVRAIREAYAKQFNFDLDAICRDLEQKEKKSGRKLVSFSDDRKEHPAKRKKKR